MGTNGNQKNLRRAVNDICHSLNRLRIRLQPLNSTLTKMIGVLSFIAAISCIVGLIVFIGFEHNSADGSHLIMAVRAAQTIFIMQVLFNLIFNWHDTLRRTHFFKWVTDIAIVITLLPMLIPDTGAAWISLPKFLYDSKVVFTVTGIYAIIELCYGIVRLMGRRTNPSLMMAVSFLFFIVIGSFVLMMPRCTENGIGYIDSLFVSTSAVCITGLSSVDIPTTFTPFGILVLSLLIQIGGLGVMTFTSFFALFFSGGTSVYSQLMVKDMIYSKTINALLPTLLYILGFTLVIEAIGAACIFASIHGTLGLSLKDELIFAGFHSLSSFCNVGFSNFDGGLSNPALLYSHQSVYLISSALIFAGGIGFPILVNLKSVLFSHLRRIWQKFVKRGRHIEPVHIYDMNTKIVLTSTLIIFAASALMFFIFEYDNALAGMSLYDKVTQSVFNAFVPRSSGFTSLEPGGFMNITIMMMIVLMWIGGGSQSTAGGVKVNTVAVIFLELKAVITGRQRVTVYNRTLSRDTIRHASAVVTLSIICYTLFSFLLVALEPGMPVKSLLFESASALFTVGASMGITAELCDNSKVLLCVAMFAGRVGIISLLIGFAGHRKDTPVKYPIDSVIIN